MRTLFSICLLLVPCFAFAQWIPLPQSVSNINSCVWFLNKDTGFVAGDSAYYHTMIQRTLDGGQTWQTTIIHNGLMPMGICFPDGTTGYCGGQDGKVYKTINMGQSWSYVSTVGNNADFSALHFTSRDTGFVTDFTGRIFKTTDGALTWTPVFTVQASFQNFYPGTGDFFFVDDSTGFVANGNYGVVLKTTDAGTTWMPIVLPSAYTWAMAIHMFNKDTGMVVAEEGKIWRTINGGTSWTGPDSIGPYDLLDVVFFNDSTGYIVGGENSNYIFHPPPYPPVGGIIYVTSNRGQTWSVDTMLCCDWLTMACKAGNVTGYAVGWEGWLLKIDDATVLASVKNQAPPSQVQIFPNPADEMIEVQMDEHIFQLQLHDAGGRIIAANFNSAQLDVRTLADGIYFLEISTNTFHTTQKIIIHHSH